MPSLHSGGDAQQHELAAMSDSQAHDDESPLNASVESSTVAVEEGGEAEGAGASSVPSASFNFINTIVGAGIIGIPYSIHQARHPRVSRTPSLTLICSAGSSRACFSSLHLASPQTTACACS